MLTIIILSLGIAPSYAVPNAVDLGSNWNCTVQGVQHYSSDEGIPNFTGNMPKTKTFQVCLATDAKVSAANEAAKIISESDSINQNRIQSSYSATSVSCKQVPSACILHRWATSERTKPSKVPADQLYLECRNPPFNTSGDCQELAEKSYSALGCTQLKGSCSLASPKPEIPHTTELRWVCGYTSDNCAPAGTPGTNCTKGYVSKASKDANRLTEKPLLASVSVCREKSVKNPVSSDIVPAKKAKN